MRLKNVLLIVRDIEKSKAFYHDLFDMHVVTDFGKNVILTEGLVLEERALWENSIGKTVKFCGNDKELYFETFDFDGFIRRLTESKYPVEYVTAPDCEKAECEEERKRRVIRIYDPDRHMIEVAESINKREP